MDTKEKNKEKMLTTTDNPYDPFKEFEEWVKCDRQKGYNTLEWIASVVSTKVNNVEELDDETAERLRDQAIEELNRLNPRGNFKIVYKD